MECVKRITIIEQVQVTGSLGTVMWFVPFRQYCYEDETTDVIGCDCHAISGTQMSYYRVVINDEDFLVPEPTAVANSRELSSWNQNWRDRGEHFSDQPADMWATYKELTGIDIKAGNTVVNNGYDIWRKGQTTQEGQKTGVGTDTTK